MLKFRKGKAESPSGNLLVYCRVRGENPFHPSARLIVSNVVVSFVSASDNNFPVVIFPPAPIFTREDFQKLLSINKSYDVIQVDDFEVPTDLSEADYIKDRMEDLNQVVLEYVELCQAHVEARLNSGKTPEAALETETEVAAPKPTADEKSALDFLDSYVSEKNAELDRRVPLLPAAPSGQLAGETKGADTKEAPDPGQLDLAPTRETPPTAPQTAGVFDREREGRLAGVIHYLKSNFPQYDVERFERIVHHPGTGKLARLYVEKYRAVFDERYEAAAKLKARIDELETEDRLQAGPPSSS